MYLIRAQHSRATHDILGASFESRVMSFIVPYGLIFLCPWKSLKKGALFSLSPFPPPTSFLLSPLYLCPAILMTKSLQTPGSRRLSETNHHVRLGLAGNCTLGAV